MRRSVVIALGVGLVFYALSDILLWQRIFEANHLWQYDAQYQTGHVAILVALIGTGMVLLWNAGWWAVWYGLAFYTLAFGGLADVMYYWLDGRSIPAALPWLEANHLILFHPVTTATLVLSAGAWIAVWLGSLLASRDFAMRRRLGSLRGGVMWPGAPR
jgi:hypothetical protein